MHAIALRKTSGPEVVLHEARLQVVAKACIKYSAIDIRNNVRVKAASVHSTKLEIAFTAAMLISTDNNGFFPAVVSFFPGGELAQRTPGFFASLRMEKRCAWERNAALKIGKHFAPMWKHKEFYI
jgi:hypothetical protein